MKRTKHIIALTMTILLTAVPVLTPAAFASSSITAAAREPTADDFDYINCGDHIEITRYKSTKYVMQIPEEIDGLPVTKIAPGAFRKDGSISIAYLPACIEEIGDEAFAGCSGLQILDLRPGLTKIGRKAFTGSLS